MGAKSPLPRRPSAFMGTLQARQRLRRRWRGFCAKPALRSVRFRVPKGGNFRFDTGSGVIEFSWVRFMRELSLWFHADEVANSLIICSGRVRKAAENSMVFDRTLSCKPCQGL